MTFFHFCYSFIPFDLRPGWNVCFTFVWCTFEFLLSNIISSNIFFMLYTRVVARPSLSFISWFPNRSVPFFLLRFGASKLVHLVINHHGAPAAWCTINSSDIQVHLIGAPWWMSVEFTVISDMFLVHLTENYPFGHLNRLNITQWPTFGSTGRKVSWADERRLDGQLCPHNESQFVSLTEKRKLNCQLCWHNISQFIRIRRAFF